MWILTTFYVTHVSIFYNIIILFLMMIWTTTDALLHPMAKVGNLDPRINDNHTYLSWVVTHSIQDGRYQAHIRKFFLNTFQCLGIPDKSGTSG